MTPEEAAQALQDAQDNQLANLLALAPGTLAGGHCFLSALDDMAAFAETLSFSASRRNQRGWKTALIFAAPALLLFTLFIVLPVIDAGGASVYNWNGLRAPTWDKFIGFGNYIQLMGNKTFRSAVANTGLLIAASLFIQLPLGLAMATLLARRQWGTVAFRMIFFLPFILADVAAGLIFHYIFDGDVGLVSLVSQHLGFGPVAMLADKNQAILRSDDRGPVEVFRLPHDALHRRHAGDRPQSLRGRRNRRRQWLAAVLARHRARHRLDHQVVGVLRHPRLAPVLRSHRAR